ncbi:MAG TPA: glycosyltransferase family 9 protein [Syntrophales bacterium]|nr:glycosyltransferase family 9 protein [Syntrophales bacterium]
MLLRDHFKITKKIKNILIIQLGDIGDVVWTTPTVWASKETYPEANVSILVRRGFGSLLEADPSVHKIFEVPNTQGNLASNVGAELRLIRKLRREKFDLVLDLRSGDRGAFMAFLTGAPVRGSLYHTAVPFWRNWLFTHLLADLPVPKERILGAAEQSLCIARGFGIVGKSTIPRLWVSDRVMARACEIMAGCGMTPDASDERKWITVNPFSRWSYKEWADDKWVKVINWLWDEFQLAAAVVGSKEEAARAADLLKNCKGIVRNLAGSTTLAELAGVLRLSRLHLGVDSAAPHIAAAVGRPTITIYGPSDWRDWAPVGDQHRVVVLSMDCVPCHKKGCDGSGVSQCLEKLGMEPVKKAIRYLIERTI